MENVLVILETLLWKELEQICKNVVQTKLKANVNFSEIKSEVTGALANFIYEKTGRKPIILPVIMDIKKES